MKQYIMIKPIGLLLLTILLFGCKDPAGDKQKEKQKVEFNQELANELERMVVIDQIAANMPKGEYKRLTAVAWKSFKDSVYRTHQKRLSTIFDEHGFAGYDLVGKEGSSNFWLMVQHSDHDPVFQEKMLQQMKIEVDKQNADSRNYGLLVDRVKLNTGEAQVYGTQVTYNMHIGQAYPKKLADSANVNERRRSIGLEPLEEYLNSMTRSHFRMNEHYYLGKGVTAPTFYGSNSGEDISEEINE